MAADAWFLEENAEDLYQNAPCGYLSLFPDGTVVKVNRTFLAWTGYEAAAVLGSRLPDFLTVGARIHYETHFHPLLQMQGEVREIAWDILRADGSPLPVLVNAVQRRDDTGRAILHRMTVFDATDRRAYERELQAARRRAENLAKTRAELVSTIGHDIRSPLQAVFTAAQLLQEQAPAELQRYVRLITSATEQVLDLTDNILEASRLDAGLVSLQEKPFRLADFVAETVGGLRAMAEQKGLAFRVELEESLPELVLGDPVRLRQVLTNLLGNAVKFTSRGEVRLDVRAAQDPSEIEFHVSDTGIGIPPDRLSAVFEEFQQAGPEIASTFGGKGLGLAIARRIVELHGARLEVSSTPGEGSTFWFRLRLRRPAAEVGAA